MAFINEPLTQQQISTLDPDVYSKPMAPKGEPIETTRWVIDRDRDVFLVALGTIPPDGSGRGIPLVMVLSYRGQPFTFDASYYETGKWLERNLVGHWTVDDMKNPPSQGSELSEVMNLIREGLAAMGNMFGDPDCLMRSDVEFGTK